MINPHSCPINPPKTFSILPPASAWPLLLQCPLDFVFRNAQGLQGDGGKIPEMSWGFTGGIH